MNTLGSISFIYCMCISVKDVFVGSYKHLLILIDHVSDVHRNMNSQQLHHVWHDTLPGGDNVTHLHITSLFKPYGLWLAKFTVCLKIIQL